MEQDEDTKEDKLSSRRGITLMAGALALVVMTGCFGIRGFSWSETRLKAGGSVVLNLTLAPQTRQSHADNRPWVLLGFPKNEEVPGDTYLSVGKLRKFDTEGNFGAPKNLIKDQQLATYLSQTDDCQEGGLEPKTFTPQVTWVALRTHNNVDDQQKVARIAKTRIRVKAAEGVGENVPGVAIFVGAWGDDDDGVVEQDEILCTSGAFTSIPTYVPN
jgi:hypothetical protein